MKRFRFTILAIILMIGILAGSWIVERFLPASDDEIGWQTDGFQISALSER